MLHHAVCKTRRVAPLSLPPLSFTHPRFGLGPYQWYLLIRYEAGSVALSGLLGWVADLAILASDCTTGVWRSGSQSSVCLGTRQQRIRGQIAGRSNADVTVHMPEIDQRRFGTYRCVGKRVGTTRAERRRTGVAHDMEDCPTFSRERAMNEQQQTCVGDWELVAATKLCNLSTQSPKSLLELGRVIDSTRRTCTLMFYLG